MVFLECPAALWLVAVDFIEEVSLEDGIVGLKVLLLLLILDVSKVRVVLKIEAFACLKTSEGLVSLHLVGKGQFHRAVRDDVAIILNSSYMIVKPIDLFQVNSDN